MDADLIQKLFPNASKSLLAANQAQPRLQSPVVKRHQAHIPTSVKPTYDAGVKVRLYAPEKNLLELMARSRGLDLSDVIREVIRDYLRKHRLTSHPNHNRH